MRRLRLRSLGLLARFQFTHPRGVRLPYHRGHSTRLNVSIHAPAWGATANGNVVHKLPSKFQFTHPRGVRRANSPIIANVVSFNSRTRVGCDLRRHKQPDRRKDSFNSRTRVGCDHRPRYWPHPQYMFQFTHPRGVRPLVTVLTLARESFNSRTRVGCDYSRSTPVFQGL